MSGSLSKLSDTVEAINDQDVSPRTKPCCIRDEYSEAGFSTTGDGERAICADCHMKPRPLPGEDLSKLHAELNPRCEYVIKVICANKTDEEEFVRPNMQRNEPKRAKTKGRKAAAAAAQHPVSQDRRSVLRNKLLCKTCDNRPWCIMFRPCHHAYSCEECAMKESKCKECKCPIKEKEKIYIA